MMLSSNSTSQLRGLPSYLTQLLAKLPGTHSMPRHTPVSVFWESTRSTSLPIAPRLCQMQSSLFHRQSARRRARRFLLRRPQAPHLHHPLDLSAPPRPTAVQLTPRQARPSAVQLAHLQATCLTLARHQAVAPPSLTQHSPPNPPILDLTPSPDPNPNLTTLPARYHSQPAQSASQKPTSTPSQPRQSQQRFP